MVVNSLWVHEMRLYPVPASVRDANGPARTNNAIGNQIIFCALISSEDKVGLGEEYMVKFKERITASHYLSDDSRIGGFFKSWMWKHGG